MPIYDFRCRKCGHHYELLVHGSVVPLCPECESGEAEKLVSIPAPQTRTKKILARARGQAAREGHFSNYSPSERPVRE